MKSKLHRNLHHHTAEHKGRIGRSTAGGEGPGTKQAQSFDDMVTLWNVSQRTPHKPRYRTTQRVQQIDITPSANTNDGPEE
jgi:hypothetical protein